MSDPRNEPKREANTDVVRAKRVRYLDSAVTYSTAAGVRKTAQPGDDLSDMCDADREGLDAQGLIKTRLDEIKG